MEAIILCGGKGTRLKPTTKDLPKALVKVKGKALLDHKIEWLKKHNVSKIILACGYLHEKIRKHLGNKFIYSIETEPLGTAGAVKKALEHVEGRDFLVVNVDDLTDVDINKFRKIGSNAICLGRPRSRFGVVHTHGNRVLGFQEKPILKNIWVNIGVYLLNKELELPDKGSLERDVFPFIDLKAFKHDGFWHTINTVKDIEEFEGVKRD